MKTRGLGFKILAGLFLISLVAMSSLILILRLYLAETLEGQLARRGVSIARGIAEQSVSPILTRNLFALDLILHDHKKQDNDLVYIFAANRAREPLSHTFTDGFPVGLKKLVEVSSAQTFTPIRFGDEDVIDISVPIMDNQLGRLHVGMSREGIQKEISAILFTVSGTIVILFMAAAGAMWLYLERVAVRPVKALGHQVRLLGEGHFDAHAAVDSDDEIGMLGRAFNEMGQHLNELYSQMADRSSELLRLNAQLEQLAITDGLTGLNNHRHFYTRLGEEIKRAKRYQHPLSLIISDIDHFKHYNDTRGHVAGDKVLKIIAGLIAENARENDLVARYGGEEFAVILPETDLATARLAAERMRVIIECSPELAELALEAELSITMSFGVAELDLATESPKGFVRLADAMLYKAKQNGRNRVEG